MSTEPVTPGEHELIRKCRTGERADLLEFDDKRVRALFIESLLTEGLEPPNVVRAIWLANAQIEGRLNLSGLRVDHPIAFEQCTFDHPPDLNHTRLLSLGFQQCTLPGLTAESMDVKGSLRMEDATLTGCLTLVGARIGGTLYLRRAHLDAGSDQYALEGSRLTVGGHFSCTDATVMGQLRLISADIGGVLNLRGTQIARPGKVCLQGERMKVGEGIWFGTRFIARGRVLLNHCEVGGAIDLSGSTLIEPEVMEENDELAGRSVSFRAQRVAVARNLLFTKGFSAEGGLVVSDATIAGRLSFKDAGNCGSGATIDLKGTSAGQIELLFAAAPTGTIDLRDARTDVLVDDPRTWPATLEIDGFMYSRLRPEGDVSVRKRIDWLRRSARGYAPQPYEQLVAAYRADGQEQEARRVALAHQVARRRKLNWPGRLWGGLLLITVGYGYRTWLAILWLAALAAIGTVAFSRGTPTAQAAQPAPFDPFVYTMDLLLPIGDFGQEVAWRFDSHLQWLAWSCVVAGWLLTSAVISGLARTISR